LASENLRGLGSAFGSFNDPQVNQFTLKSDRAEFGPQLLEQRFDQELRFRRGPA